MIELIHSKNIRKLHNYNLNETKDYLVKNLDLELKIKSTLYIKTIINDLPLVHEDELIFLTLPTPKQECSFVLSKLMKILKLFV